MSPFPRIEQFGTADWVSLVILVASLCFAVFMSWQSRGSDHRLFLSFFLEGVTLAAAGILLISFFYTPLFDTFLVHKEFLIIIACMTMANGFRDVAATIHRSRPSLSEHEAEKRK